VSEVVLGSGLRAALNDWKRTIDEAFATRLRIGQEQGKLRADADQAMLARLASATLYFLAIRARAGEKRDALEATAEAGIALICGGRGGRDPD